MFGPTKDTCPTKIGAKQSGPPLLCNAICDRAANVLRAVNDPTSVVDVFFLTASVSFSCGRLNADGHLIMYFEKIIDGTNAQLAVIRKVVIPSPVPNDTNPKRRDQMREFGNRFSRVHRNVVRSRRLMSRRTQDVRTTSRYIFYISMGYDDLYLLVS